MVVSTHLSNLLCSLPSLVVALGLGYLFLFFFQPEWITEIRTFILADISSHSNRSNNRNDNGDDSNDVDVASTEHGMQVVHPFGKFDRLPVGDPLLDSFLRKQQEKTDNYFEDELQPSIKCFVERLMESQSYEHLENPISFGGTYFFFKRVRPELLQYSLFSTTDLKKEASLVFDPNTIRFASPAGGEKSDDPSVDMPIVHATWISEDGFKIAYGTTDNMQSNSMTIRVRDLQKRRDLTFDILHGCQVDYTSLSWIDSRTGFFYTMQVQLRRSVSSDGEMSSMSGATAAAALERDTASPPAVEEEIKISNRVLFHRIGTPQDNDFVVFENVVNHDNLVIQTRVTSDGHYLLLDIFKRKREVSFTSFWRNAISEHSSISPVGNKVFYYDLAKFDGMYAESLGSCVKLIDTFSFRFDYVSNIEEDFWFRTNYHAANFRVVRVTLPNLNAYDEDPEQDFIMYELLQAWKKCLDWIPQRLDGDFLESADIAAHTVMVLKYLKHSSHEVLLYDLTQNLVHESQIPVADLPHPPHGTISGPYCNFYSSEIFYSYSDFSEPASIYRATIERDTFTGSIEISFQEVHTTHILGIDKYQFQTIQQYCETKRNVYVPLLISGLREVIEEEKTSRPCIVCINGGFGVSYTPRLSLPLLLFAQYCRGIVVCANIQGSGIYGSDWVAGGRKENKEHAFNDLVCILRHLVRKKYTSHSHIAIIGGTYNGLLIGNAIAKCPALFSCAVVIDGLFDLMKYECFSVAQRSTLSQEQGGDEILLSENEVMGSTWYQEFGHGSESEEEMKRILLMSPLHQLEEGVSNAAKTKSACPAVLLLAGWSILLLTLTLVILFVTLYRLWLSATFIISPGCTERE